MRNCIKSKIDAGIIDRKNGQEMLEYYDGYLRQYAGNEAKAQVEFLKHLDLATSVKKKQLITMCQARERFFKAGMEGVRDGVGFEKGIERLLHDDSSGKMNFENLSETIRATSMMQLREGLNKLKPTLFGNKSSEFKLNLPNLINELFGKTTGNTDMAALAKSWADVAEVLRLRFNQAGGDIPYNKDWRLPQSHDSQKIKKAGADVWKEYVRPLLDWDKIVDFDSGLKMDTLKQEAFLSEIYDTLSTDGLNKMDPDVVGGKGKMVANRHKEHRAMIFKDAEGWLAYNKNFGNDNPVKAMIGHIEMMSKEIAQMEIFGANPKHTRALIERHITLREGEKADRRLGSFDNLWQEVFGYDKTGHWLRLGKIGNFIRGWLSACQLGSAIISSFTDPVRAAIIAAFDEGSALGFARTFKQIGLQAGSAKSRAVAKQLGFVVDGTMRFMRDNYERAFDFSLGQQMNSAVMKVSLLEKWTELMQSAFQMELSTTMARAMEDAKIAPRLGKLLERFGIDKEKIVLSDIDGTKYVNLTATLELDRVVGERLYNLFLSERNDAVINSSLKTQAFIHQGQAPGALTGEILRALGQYKSFPITFMMKSYSRLMREENFTSKAGYAVATIGLMTMMGAVSLQTKQVISGKNTRPMNTKEFWAAAMAQGGGTGIFGDLLFSDVNRFGGGILATLGGPTLGLVEDFGKLTLGNFHEFAKGDDTHFGSEAVRTLGHLVPGSNLWYAKLAYERLFLDQMKYLTDPKASRYFRNVVRKTKKDYGQTYWWKPGETTPE